MSLLDRLKQLFAEAKVQAEPVAAAPAAGVAGPNEPPAERRRKKRVNAVPGTKVLVIDDSPTIVLLLSRMLRQNKFNVLEAGDGESGIEIARRERPGLIFLDIVLPGMSGFTALRTLRHDPVTKDIPIIMISGNAQATEQFYVQRIGADNFMKKPFSRAEVFTYIERLLDEQFVPRRFNTYVHDTTYEPANDANGDSDADSDLEMDTPAEPAAAQASATNGAAAAAVTSTVEAPVAIAAPEMAAVVADSSDASATAPAEPAPAAPPAPRSIFEDINAGWRMAPPTNGPADKSAGSSA